MSNKLLVWCLGAWCFLVMVFAVYYLDHYQLLTRSGGLLDGEGGLPEVGFVEPSVDTMTEELFAEDAPPQDVDFTGPSAELADAQPAAAPSDELAVPAPEKKIIGSAGKAQTVAKKAKKKARKTKKKSSKPKKAVAKAAPVAEPVEAADSEVVEVAEAPAADPAPAADDGGADFGEWMPWADELKVARELGASGDTVGAIDFYSAYLEKGQGAVEQWEAARLELARAQSWEKQYDASIDGYIAYLEARPEDLDARVEMGVVMSWAGYFERAVSAFAQVLTASPDHPRALVGMARALNWWGKPEEAIAAYERYLRTRPKKKDRAEARQELALVRMGLKPRAGGSAAEPEWLAKAHASVADGNNAEAVKFFQRHLEENPGDLDALLELARVQSWEKAYAAAIEGYGRYLDKRPDDLTAAQELAQVLGWTERYGESIRQWHNVIALAPNSTDAHLGLARTYSWSGDPDAAERVYSAVLEIDPDNRTATEELDKLRRAVEQGGSVGGAGAPGGGVPMYLAKARHFSNQGDYARAADYYERHLRDHIGDRDARLEAARVYAWMKEYGWSLRYYREHLEDNPNDIEVRLEMAKVLSWSGRYEHAVRHFEDVLQDLPRSAEAQLGLARALRWAGDKAGSLHAYERAVELDPMNPGTRDELSAIQREFGPTVGLAGRHFSDNEGFALNSVGIRGHYFPMAELKIENFVNQLFLGSSLLGRTEKAAGTEAGAIVTYQPLRWLSVGGRLQYRDLSVTNARISGALSLMIKPFEKTALTLEFSNELHGMRAMSLQALQEGVVGNYATLTLNQGIGDRVGLWARVVSGWLSDRNRFLMGAAAASYAPVKAEDKELHFFVGAEYMGFARRASRNNFKRFLADSAGGGEGGDSELPRPYNAYWSPELYLGGHAGAQWKHQIAAGVGYHIKTSLGPNYEEGAVTLGMAIEGGFDLELDSGFSADLSAGYRRNGRQGRSYDGRELQLGLRYTF